MTKRMGEEQVQVGEHLTTVHQINTKDSQERSCSSISAEVLNSFWINLKRIVRKKRKIKQGEQDENEITHMAASSLLALVNVLDKSNKFNRLDEMRNHMSKRLLNKEVTFKQQTKKSLWKKQGQKKFSWFEQYNFIFKLIRRQHNDNTKRSKETKKIQWFKQQ